MSISKLGTTYIFLGRSTESRPNPRLDFTGETNSGKLTISIYNEAAPDKGKGLVRDWTATGVFIRSTFQKIMYYLRSYFSGTCFLIKNTQGWCRYAWGKFDDKSIKEVSELAPNDILIKKVVWKNLFNPYR